jgi:hypothetical protein
MRDIQELIDNINQQDEAHWRIGGDIDFFVFDGEPRACVFNYVRYKLGYGPSSCRMGFLEFLEDFGLSEMDARRMMYLNDTSYNNLKARQGIISFLQRIKAKREIEK